MSDARAVEAPNGHKQAKGGGAKSVYETLKGTTLSLEPAPGTPLDETSIAHRFAMSRSPVREALVRLSGDGLAEMLSNRSTLVAPINLAEFPRCVEALDLLQRVNTRLAAQHRTAADIEGMLNEAGAFERACASGDHLEMPATIRDFHMTVAEAGRNSYLARANGQLLDEGRRILHMHFDCLRDTATDELLTSEQLDVVRAIEARDIEAADRRAHEHTRQFHDRFASFMRANSISDLDLSITLSD